MPALCRRAGAGRGARLRKPRKEETAGRKRRGSAGRELWGFEGRGRIGHMAAGAGYSRCWRRKRTRRAFSGARARAAGVGAAAGESLRRSRGHRVRALTRGWRRRRSALRGGKRGDCHEVSILIRVADMTLSCPRPTWPALALRHAEPWARKTSATSRRGRHAAQVRRAAIGSRC
jgi:hypothetical protein